MNTDLAQLLYHIEYMRRLMRDDPRTNCEICGRGITGDLKRMEGIGDEYFICTECYALCDDRKCGGAEKCPMCADGKYAREG